MGRRLLACHSAVAAADRVALRRGRHLVDTARLPCSASRLIPSINSAPGLGDWPGLLLNFACAGTLSPGFDAMIRRPVAQNLNCVPVSIMATSHTRDSACAVLCRAAQSASARVHPPDSISAIPRQRSSPPRSFHTRRPARAGRAAFPRRHFRLHASHPHSRTSTHAQGLRERPSALRAGLGSSSQEPWLSFPAATSSFPQTIGSKAG